jgi:FixJ family two-component response regulator
MKRQTVYIVDDDAAVCDSIKELAESVRLNAECYTSARAFLDQYQMEYQQAECQGTGDQHAHS